MKSMPHNEATRESEMAGLLSGRVVARYLLPAACLALLAGCATAGRAKVTVPDKPAPAAVNRPAPLPDGPSVVRLADGREEYVIKEAATMDARSTADFEQANALLRQGNYQQAAELLEKVIAKVPEKSAPRINIAIAYRHLDKPDLAEKHLKKALELVPGHPVASNEYGLLLREAGRFMESRQVYEKSLAKFPKYHPIQKNLGILCDLYLRDYVCALEHYQIYDRAMPEDRQVKLWIADLNLRAGKSMTASTRTDHQPAASKQ